MAKQIKIKITSAVSIGGKIITPGKTLDLDEPLAKNLLQRGKAELSTVNVDDKQLGKMTVAELKAEAKELGIEGADDMNKAKLIAAIEEAGDE
ncbi:Rho termination factor N-terminal domain-containing protein [uncultured Ruegeria sp.]|uniref:Rho termination factor N-terminal domain-containing protein n=1 Tax=uncultured Ruegeria sp. TaxID=259304 RepID=UPI0026258A22|nr:Rho termination factor N-terminal domain-containing protein [uncultured Ruegeria sp.]